MRFGTGRRPTCSTAAHPNGPTTLPGTVTCNTTGAKLSKSPATDGEEYFVMALFFVAHRWGNGSGIYNHDSEAKVNGVTNMFD